MKPYAFGVDIGGTTIKMGFFDTEGKLLDKWEITTRTENNGEKVLPDIARSIKKKLKENELTLDDLAFPDPSFQAALSTSASTSDGESST